MIRRSLAAVASLIVVAAGLVGLSPLASATAASPIDLGVCFVEGGLVLSDSGATAYVGCSTGGVARVTLASRNVGVVGGSDMPGGLASAGNSAYATFGITRSLVKIPPTGLSTTAPNFSTPGSPGAVASSPDDSYAVVAVQDTRNHLALVRATGTPAKVFLTGSPTEVVTYASGGTDYALTIINVEGTYRLQKVNLGTKTIDGLPIMIAGAMPTDLAMAPNGDFAYIVQDDGQVLRFSAATEAITAVATIASDSPRAIAFTPDSAWAYVLGADSASFSPEVTRINTSSGALTYLPNAYSGFPAGIAVSPAGDRFYVATGGEQNLLYTTETVIPSVTEISPARVSLLGGDEITISGRNLSDLKSLTVAGKDCPVATKNATKIVCTVPAGSPDKGGPVEVIVKTGDGRTAVSGMLEYVLNVGPAKGADAFTSANSAQVFFTGSSLKSAYLKGYQISMQSLRSNGSTTPWAVVKTTSGFGTAVTLTRAALGVDAGEIVRFRVNTLATTGALSLPTNASPWRQMTDEVAAPPNFSATYDSKTDWMTMRWDEPRPTVPGGRNVHAYEFQYLWPGERSWTSFGTPFKSSDTSSVWDLGNLPRGTLKVRIRSISWPEKYFSEWTTEAAIRK